jgi:GT2 family glycosyltransferase
MIHILMPVHNRADVTACFLASLQAQSDQNYCLWLVDDGCNDDTVARAQALVPQGRLRVLHGDGNLWWAGALQKGYEALCSHGASEEDAVLIVNDDMTFEADFLSQGLAVLAENPAAAIQAVGIDNATRAVDRGAVADLFRLAFRPASPGEQANCLSTRGLIMRYRVFRQSGGFRPDRLPHYLSDYEFTLRLRRLGVPLLCDERFRARVNLEMTGDSRYSRAGFAKAWSAAFSNRSKYNPRHWTQFVLMVCPRVVIPFQLLRIWGRFVFAMARSSLAPILLPDRERPVS